MVIKRKTKIETRKWKLEKGNWLGGAWMAPLHKRQRQPRKRSFVKAGIRGQKLVPVLHRVRSNQETREQPPRPRAALPFSPRCVTLKRAPRRSPNLFFQRPLHHNPRFFTESIDKRFRPSGSADQLRVHDSRNNQGVLAPSIVQRLSGRYMQRIARVPQSHDDICVERRCHFLFLPPQLPQPLLYGFPALSDPRIANSHILRKGTFFPHRLYLLPLWPRHTFPRVLCPCRDIVKLVQETQMRLYPWPISSLPPSRGNRSGGELLFDSFVEARAGEPRGHTDGVFYRIGIGTSMANHADAAHTQKRRATILRIIDLPLQAFERPLRKLCPDLRKNRAFQRLLQQIEDRNRQTFANLQSDVAYETIAHNHVHAAGKKISAFDVPYEMHRTLLQQSIDLAGQHVALDFFLPHREQAHTRAPVAKRGAVIHFTHHRKLHQMLRPRIHIRPHVQQHRNAASRVGKGRCQGHAVHGLKRAENELRRGHDRAGISGAEHAIGLAIMNQSRRHVHGAVLLSPESLRRVIVHGDHYERS